ncbi:hypothetical protein [uncultured Chryseobacterium sp.]|uniref:hypothetical protein n=1 Tax=uncultured Chryseobacterium sp. TaxID=259322 RepID=UPI00374A6460
MKKQFLTLITLVSTSMVFSQVGINTQNPKANFHIDGAKDNPATGIPTSVQASNDFAITKDGNVGIGTITPRGSLDINRPTSNIYGFVLPANSNTINIINPQGGTIAPGTIIYESTADCIKMYRKTNTWSDCLTGSGSAGSGTITSLDCDHPVNSGTLTENTNASGVSSQISYTGGNNGDYTAQNVSSTGVTGLIAQLTAGNFTNGSGILTYNITGTPSNAGTAYFSIVVGGISCQFSRVVGSSVNIPSGITLATDQKYFVVSVFDNDYLPYTVPTAPASTNIINADGSPDPVIDIAGSITTAGIPLKISVSATGSGTVPAFSQTITIPASLTQDGVSRNLNLSWSSQSYTASSKYINATLKTVSGTLYAKKLDLNAGLGNDYLGILLGEFGYPYNNSGSITSYQVRIIPGIPDKMFGQSDNNGDNSTHNLLYLPITAEDGNIWLNNNLGADYNNLNSTYFNPSKQATASNDYHAYGSLFQWGRKNDSHELVNWSSVSAGTLVYPFRRMAVAAINGITTEKGTINNTTGSLADWITPSDNTLWNNEATLTNPCPSGFRVPSSTEFSTLLSNAGISNATTALNSTLKLPVTLINMNYGVSNGTLSTDSNNITSYWTSTPNSTLANRFYFGNSGGAGISAVPKANSLPVRCIKD